MTNPAPSIMQELLNIKTVEIPATYVTPEGNLAAVNPFNGKLVVLPPGVPLLKLVYR